MSRSLVALACALVAMLAPPPRSVAEQTGLQPAPPRGHPEARCPATVAVEEQVPEEPEGWTVTQRRTGHRLAGVTFFDGPPSENASLVYDTTSASGDDWIATWRFPTSARGYWILCRYEATTIELARMLPPAVTVCHVAYDKRIVTDPRHDEVRRIECE